MTALEEQVKQSAADKLNAVLFEIMALHGELRVFRQETKERLDGIDQRLDEHGRMLEETLTFQREMQAFRQETQGALQEILRRLPPAADD